MQYIYKLNWITKKKINLQLSAPTLTFLESSNFYDRFIYLLLQPFMFAQWTHDAQNDRSPSFELARALDGRRPKKSQILSHKPSVRFTETISVVTRDSVAEEKQIRVASAIAHENLIFVNLRAISWKKTRMSIPNILFPTLLQSSKLFASLGGRRCWCLGISWKL